MKAEELDAIFDRGDDITPYLDLSSVRRLNLEQKRVNVDLPCWMIQTLDDEADRIGVTRQSIIKVWIAEKIKTEIQIPNKVLHSTGISGAANAASAYSVTPPAGAGSAPELRASE